MTERGDAEVPLTQSQRLIWTGQSLAPEAPLYNMIWRIGLTGPLDPGRFAAAWARVVAGSDILRARFQERDGQPVQRIGAVSAALDMVDLTAEPEPAAAADAQIAEDGARPVDLTQSTWRSRLFKLSETEWIWYLNQHHIGTDGAAGAVLLTRVGQAYGGTAPAEPWPQFADYARGQATAAESGQDTAIAAFWDGLDASGRAMTPIYGGKRRPASPASRRFRLPFSEDTAARFEACLRDGRFAAISPDLARFALWASLYGAWLSRVTGDPVIRIGAPFHNRLSPAEQDTLGVFIELFPLPIAIEPGDTLATLYPRVLRAAIDYLRHARPGASTAASAATFNAVLNFMPAKLPGLPGLKTETRWLHSGAHDGGHDTRLHVYDFNGTGLPVVELDVNEAVLDGAMAEAAGDHFLALASGALEDPDRALDGIALTGAAASVLSGPQSGPAPRSVAEAIAAHAGAGTVAVSCGAETMSHRDLSDLSDRFAGALAGLGVAPGQAVAVWAPRSLHLPAALLGIWKAGAHFVPIPADTPPDRAARLLGRLQPAAVILGEGLRPPEGLACAALEIAAELPAAELPAAEPPATASVPGADENALAYIIFTSGSTGEPKGVEVTHGAFARYIDWASRSYGPDGPKTYPLCSAIGFDLTLTSIFVPLVTGGSVRVYPETPGGTDLAILDVFAEDAVDVVKLTPAHLALITAQARPVNRISTLILGGENLTTRACRQARSALGRHLVIANEYGPTEAVVGCMIHRFDPTRDTGVNVPIGLPADDMTIAVLDAGGNPVPQGVTGEIHIGGARLARGYFQDRAQTAQKFRPNPHAGTLAYASGDLARLRADGAVEYLGRADQQLKLSGVRIEPAEIEAALADHPAVSAAHVLAWTGTEDSGTRCIRCGLGADVPGVTLDDEAVCSICRDYARIETAAQAYFDTPEALKSDLAEARRQKRGKYDAIMLLSGGKDSAYALYRLAEITRDVLVLTLDNGFISDGAKDNVRRMTADLGLDHRFLTTPAMNEIFRDSLSRFSNVCQGCFKTIYALALKVARDEGIPAIVTGLSRGQFFETRLTPDLFRDREPTRDEIEAVVLQARKSYHGMDDAVSRLLKTKEYLDDGLLDAVRFIDIYRYIDVPVSEIYRFLAAHAPWVRPEDTGRSTNCLINDLGIATHKRREGYHNYALPYSWDVRLGHKTRDEALAELDDEIDPDRIAAMEGEIGLDPRDLPARRGGLVAYVVGDVAESDLRAFLGPRLPREMMPRHIVVMDRLPLTANGKVDRGALPRPDPVLAAPGGERLPPETPAEETLMHIYARILGHDGFGVTDNFYDIGGESIAAIRISLAAGEAGLSIAPTAVFEHQTIRALAAAAVPAGAAQRQTTRSAGAPLIDLGAEDLAALGRSLDRRPRPGGG